MSDEVKDVIMAQIRRDVLNNTLAKGVRFDGRKFDEYRPIEVQQGVIKTAEGSAIARIGQTVVLVANKFDIVKPFADRPTQGVMVSNSELLPTASPTFETGLYFPWAIEHFQFKTLAPFDVGIKVVCLIQP